MRKILFFLILALLTYKAESQTYKVISQDLTNLKTNEITTTTTIVYIHYIEGVYYFSESEDRGKPKYEIRGSVFYGKVNNTLIFRCCNGFFLLKCKYI